MMLLILIVLLITGAYGFQSFRARQSKSKLFMKSEIKVFDDVTGVSHELCKSLAKSAMNNIETKGTFHFSIPGGSILKMLGSGESSSLFANIDWSKCTMGWVNHRCVPLDDETSTEFKSSKLFLDSWKSSGLNVLSLGGSTDAITEAKRMDNLVNNIEWDLMLIGVGLDGHVGSVYPDSEAVAYQGFDCISVVKPTSSSISFSLPTMLKSKEIIIATAGKSDKYPLGKAEGMVKALQSDDTINTFPAVAFRDKAKWFMDKDASQLLKL